MTEQNNPFAIFSSDSANRAVNINQQNSSRQTSYGVIENLEHIKLTRKWTVKDLNRIITNAIQGRKDPQRNCAMCCLNALASNFKALYATHSPKKIPTNKTIIEATETLVQKGFSTRLKNVSVTLKNSNAKITSGIEIPIENISDLLSRISSNISTALDQHTPSNSLMFFSVGIGNGYHSTIIAVSKNPNIIITGGNTSMIGTNTDPLFVFIEDLGGARKFNGPTLDNKCNEFIVGAIRHYKWKGINNANIDAIIYQLNVPKG